MYSRTLRWPEFSCSRPPARAQAGNRPDSARRRGQRLARHRRVLYMRSDSPRAVVRMSAGSDQAAGRGGGVTADMAAPSGVRQAPKKQEAGVGRPPIFIMVAEHHCAFRPVEGCRGRWWRSTHRGSRTSRRLPPSRFRRSPPPSPSRSRDPERGRDRPCPLGHRR